MEKMNTTLTENNKEDEWINPTIMVSDIGDDGDGDFFANDDRDGGNHDQGDFGGNGDSFSNDDRDSGDDRDQGDFGGDDSDLEDSRDDDSVSDDCDGLEDSRDDDSVSDDCDGLEDSRDDDSFSDNASIIEDDASIAFQKIQSNMVEMALTSMIPTVEHCID
ncbi:MAG: hypothetical protein SGARI_002416, partial [Bacillariaceae sp.]